MLYPLTFKPILKSVIWGGSAICPFKGISPVQEGIGESWELSHVDGDYSIVAEGELANKSLDDLIKAYGKDLLGAHVMERFGTRFPLLIKFIDARDNLSIQVHPNDELAQKRHNSFGKTEMWYVIKADKDASLYSGFSKQITPDEYVERVKNNTIMDVLQRYDVNAGDVFFLPAGRVHAIGAGCFIAEIQQTSNITYRIYDYDRPGPDGRPRELHTDLATDVIDYTYHPRHRVNYTPQENTPAQLVKCPYFTTNLLSLDRDIERDYIRLDSFVIYMCLSGRFTITTGECDPVLVMPGETVLLPACFKNINLYPDELTRLLEIYIE